MSRSAGEVSWCTAGLTCGPPAPAGGAAEDDVIATATNAEARKHKEISMRSARLFTSMAKSYPEVLRPYVSGGRCVNTIESGHI